MRWIVIGLVIWFIVVSPDAAANVVHSITHFITAVLTS